MVKSSFEALGSLGTGHGLANSKSRVALNFSPELLFYLRDMIIWLVVFVTVDISFEIEATREHQNPSTCLKNV